MFYSRRVRDALALAVKTHAIDRRQERKGKATPYITHPLTVALILAMATDDEDVIIAGILHDTIEDSASHSPVTRAFIASQFGERVAAAVNSVTEQNKDLSWQERKHAALQEIRHFSHDALMVKSADLISNTTEIADDWRQDGDEIFSRFKGTKAELLGHYRAAINAIIFQWPENPLVPDLLRAEMEIDHMLA